MSTLKSQDLAYQGDIFNKLADLKAKFADLQKVKPRTRIKKELLRLQKMETAQQYYKFVITLHESYKKDEINPQIMQLITSIDQLINL